MPTGARILQGECVPDPWSLAEEQPFQQLLENVKRFNNKCKPEGWLHSAWSHAEFALYQGEKIDNELRQMYIEYSQNLLQWVVMDASANSDTQLEAFVLSSYLHCMQKRAFGEDVLSEDCLAIYESLGAAIGYLRPININEPPQWQMMEVAVLAMAARMRKPELLMYPGSPREEGSSVLKFNHDGYFIAKGKKLPIQQKLIPTDKVYDQTITLLTLAPILGRAFKKWRPELSGGLVGEQLNYLLSLVVAETHGEALEQDELGFLNQISSAIAQHKLDAERYHSKFAA